MTDYYEKLGLSRDDSVEEIIVTLNQIRETWKRRLISQPEKADEMITSVEGALEVFKTEESRREYDALLSKSGDNSEQGNARKLELERWKKRAEEYLDEGDVDYAKVAVDKAMKFVDNDEEEHELFNLAARIYCSIKDCSKRALDFIDSAIVFAPDIAEYHVTKVDVFFAVNRDSVTGPVYGSEQIIREVSLAERIAADENDPVTEKRAVNRLADYYFQTGNMDKATEYCNKILKFENPYNNLDQGFGVLRVINSICDKAEPDTESVDLEQIQKSLKAVETIEKFERAGHIKQRLEERKEYIYKLKTELDELNGISQKNLKILQRIMEINNLLSNGEKLEIEFGRYNSDKEHIAPIRWIVLDIKDGRALLLSKYALECRKYNEDIIDVTWETCTLRGWLNRDFIYRAFNGYEKAIIQKTGVPADRNPQYSTPPGNATQDSVFLLSVTEAEEYFKDNNERMCAPTDYAVAQGASVNNDYKADGKGTCFWWLRSPGDTSGLAANVINVGSVYYGGGRVNNDLVCVRPALWINLKS